MKNIIFAGVGGQGVILASKILMEVARDSGYDVKESEVHGMAQRGGSVDCHVRYGEKVYSPLISRGTADYIVSLEELEAMRKLEYLAPGGVMIVNREKINPAPVETGAMEYPADIEEWLSAHVRNSEILDTKEALRKAGSKKALNIVMLGALSKHLEFSEDTWTKAIRSLVRDKFVEMNLTAFNLGRDLKQAVHSA